QLAMGNCLTNSFSSTKEAKALPIDTIFKFPSPLPNWASGEGFASGTIDLGGLQVCQISSFTKIWATHEGGTDNLGATFFEPSAVPNGFSMLGCYSQPNNQPLFGWVLAGKDITVDSSSGGTLKKPIDYTLIWSSESSNFEQDDHGYIWLPTPPDGYKAVGHVVTTSPEKPSLDKIRCVRSDLTDECEAGRWIWGQGTTSSENGFNVYGSRFSIRGTKAQGVCVGTFIAQENTSGTAPNSSLACLKNNNFALFSSMPKANQIEALVQTYSPWMYFHPRDEYLPSSVDWFFSNGALLYKKGEEPNPVHIEPTGSNLPQGGSNDGEYWLDLPIDHKAREEVMKGDVKTSETYLHIKPVFGGTFSDIVVWIFYPFNGPSTAKLGLIDIPLGKIGEHVGDWEHVTFRVSNFNGVLHNVYFSQHNGGTWVDAPLLEFQNGTNKFVAYSSLHGHANYPKPGLVLQGTSEIGIRNDTARSDLVMDTGARYSIASAEHIAGIVEPPWLNYARKWGPKITYELGTEVENVENVLSGDLKSALENLVNIVPDEVFGEDGPTGPKMKSSWDGDEE
ncbi:hypothetical protein RJ639_030398, partial [Escallonia herrerae]